MASVVVSSSLLSVPTFETSLDLIAEQRTDDQIICPTKRDLISQTQMDIQDPYELVLQLHSLMIFVVACMGTISIFQYLIMGKHLPRNELVPFF